MIQVQCAGCQGRFRTRDEYAGKVTKCPSCGSPVTIPEPSAGELDLAIDLAPGTEPRSTVYQPMRSAVPPPHRRVSDTETSTLAVAAMVTSLIAIVLPCIGWLPGLVGIGLGAMAIYKITRPNSGLEGGPFAVVGIICGCIALFWAVLMIMVIMGTMSTVNQVTVANSVASTQQSMQSLHRGMVIYADDHGGHFPGIDASGDVVDATASGRLQLLVEAGFIRPEQLVFDWDNEKTPWKKTSDMTTDNFSMALLQFDDKRITTGRRKEWRKDGSGSAVLMSLRNVGTGGENVDARSPLPATAPFGTPKWAAVNADGSAAHAVEDPATAQPQLQGWGSYQTFSLVDEPRYKTSYNGVASSYDSLFLDGDGSEQGKTMVGSNAFLVHD